MLKILIIKLGAKGDVLRTLPIAVALKNKYPKSSITWLTLKSNKEIVENSPYINEVLTLPIESSQKYGLLYNFDIEPEASTLAVKVPAEEKFGFYDNSGFPSAFNLGAEYYLNTLFDDETKKTNKKTYQEMMFMAAELVYKHEFHPICLKEELNYYAQRYSKKENLLGKKILGLSIGASPRWPSKFWDKDKIVSFITLAKKEGFEIIVLSGPADSAKLTEVKKSLAEKSISVHYNDPKNSSQEFASIVGLLDFLVCGDSFALHVGLAMKKKTVALFFCTSPDEVEGYGFLKKIVSPLLYDFFPEKQDIYSEELVNSISIEEVLKAVKSM